jgi:hypothetical protein
MYRMLGALIEIVSLTGSRVYFTKQQTTLTMELSVRAIVAIGRHRRWLDYSVQVQLPYTIVLVLIAVVLGSMLKIRDRVDELCSASEEVGICPLA